MKIDVQDLQTLCDGFPELVKLRNVTDKYGEENDITVICDVIGQLYQRLENVAPKTEPQPPVDE